MAKRIIFGVLILSILAISAAVFGLENSPVSMEECVKAADEYYAGKSYTEKDRQDIMNIMIKAADKWNSSYDIQWRAARAVYVYGDAFHYQSMWDNYNTALTKGQIKDAGDVITRSQDMNSAQSKTLLDMGVLSRKYADKAVALNPQGVEGHFYSALGISLYAFGKSIVKALMEGLGPKYEGQLDEAIRINRDYDAGGLYSAYGRYWYTLPWPKRNLKKSLQDILLAVKYSPINAQMLDFLGDTYYVMGDKEKAGQAWQEAMKSPARSYQTDLIRNLVGAKFKYSQ